MEGELFVPRMEEALCLAILLPHLMCHPPHADNSLLPPWMMTGQSYRVANSSVWMVDDGVITHSGGELKLMNC